MKCSAWLSAVVLSAGLCTGAFAQVTGEVKLDGKAPARAPVAGLDKVAACAAMHKDPLLDETVVTDDNGMLANVVVYLKGAKGDVPKAPAALGQKGCQYVPHVVAMMVGQELVAQNNDAFLHNVHTLPEANEASNIAQPNTDKVGVKLKPVKAAEVIKVKCDVHPWMSAWVVALETPYFAVTDDEGKFEIPTAGLKDGQYDIVAWHEKYKESAIQKITVKGGKATAKFSFKAAKAAADLKVPAEKEMVLTSLTTGKPACCRKNCKPGDKAKEAVVAK